MYLSKRQLPLLAAQDFAHTRQPPIQQNNTIVNQRYSLKNSSAGKRNLLKNIYVRIVVRDLLKSEILRGIIEYIQETNLFNAPCASAVLHREVI